MKVRWLETSAGRKLQIAYDYKAGSALNWVDVPTEPIVPEDKTLEEKFIDKIPLLDDDVSNAMSRKNMRDLAEIAREHFAEVADRASRDYWEPDEFIRGCNNKIINAIRNEGKNDGT